MNCSSCNLDIALGHIAIPTIFGFICSAQVETHCVHMQEEVIGQDRRLESVLCVERVSGPVAIVILMGYLAAFHTFPSH